jgi:hypothetical protein
MKYPYGSIPFRSPHALQEVADILSKEMAGGIPFGGREEMIWGDIPALYLGRGLLGLRVELGGWPGEQGYELRILPRTAVTSQMSDTELGEFVSELSKRIRKDHGGEDVTYDATVTGKWESVDLSPFFSHMIFQIDRLDAKR